jgi:glutathionylspermidine synthase
MEEWRQLRLRAIFDYCKWDAHCGDQEALARFPLLLSEESAQQLADWSERLTEEALRAEEEVLGRAGLMETLSVPKAIRKLLAGKHRGFTGRPVRVMRFDFHHTTEGWRISEVNADVPGGYVEASGWNSLLAAHCGREPVLPDPTTEYVSAICAGLPQQSLIALVHATVYSEDRQLMVYLGRELEKRGMRVCLASPRNLNWTERRAALDTGFERGKPAHVVRLSPGEWLPGQCGEQALAMWFGLSATPISNPGTALILQSKRFPLIWDSLRCDLTAWRQLLPETRCPQEVKSLPNSNWVVKPAFGRVGEDVGVPEVTTGAEYAEIWRAMRKNPHLWVAQKKFEVVPVTTDRGEVYPCIGVYTVNGKFAGLYGRAARRALIDEKAFDVAVLAAPGNTRSVL